MARIKDALDSIPVENKAFDIGSTVVNGEQGMGSYRVSNHQYPEDLGSAEGDQKYGGHRVVFFINVQGGGAIARNAPVQTLDLPPSKFARVSGEQMNRMRELGANLVGNFNGDVLSILSPKKRLVSAISLYVPETLTKSYAVDWGTESGDQFLNAETIAQTILSGAEMAGLAKTNRSQWDSAKVGAKAVVGNIAAKALNGMKYAQKALGVTPGNTKAELLFNAVEFNQFSFDYRFAPKSEKEAANVLNIIRTFRHHMLPEYFDSLNYLFIYPSEFEITYYKKTIENQYLEQHMTAVLKNMTINYNPEGQFMTFDNGMPTHINMTLQFQELGIPTKETSPADRSGA